MSIFYYRKEGRVGIKYVPSYEESNSLPQVTGEMCLHDIEEHDLGLIPTEIVERGKAAVVARAKEMAKRDLAKRRRLLQQFVNKRDQRMMGVDQIIEALHSDGTLLKGRLVSNKNWTLNVLLDEPIRSRRRYLIDGPHSFASSMAGHHPFDDSGCITPYAKREAIRGLISLYEDEQGRRNHGTVVNIVEELNALAEPVDE